MDETFSKPIAVIADIHGNSDALIAVLADIEAMGVETILNLGDHLSGPLAAAETFDILLSLEMTSILGNHDRYLIEQDRDVMGPSDQVAFDQLSQAPLDWLRSLPATQTLSDQIFMCHGTPAATASIGSKMCCPPAKWFSATAKALRTMRQTSPFR